MYNECCMKVNKLSGPAPARFLVENAAVRPERRLRVSRVVTTPRRAPYTVAEVSLSFLLQSRSSSSTPRFP